MGKQSLSKEQIVSMLVDLASAINNSVEISDCDFGVSAETEYSGILLDDEPIGLDVSQMTGWKHFDLKIRWKTKITK